VNPRVIVGLLFSILGLVLLVGGGQIARDCAHFTRRAANAITHQDGPPSKHPGWTWKHQATVWSWGFRAAGILLLIFGVSELRKSHLNPALLMTTLLFVVGLSVFLAAGPIGRKFARLYEKRARTFWGEETITDTRPPINWEHGVIWVVWWFRLSGLAVALSAIWLRFELA